MPAVEIPGHTLEFPEGTSEAVMRNAIFDNFPELRPKDYETQVKARLGLAGETTPQPSERDIESVQTPAVRISPEKRALLGQSVLSAISPIGSVLGMTTTGQKIAAGVGETLGGLIEGATSPAGAATLASAPLQPQVFLPDLLEMGRSGGRKVFGGENVQEKAAGATEALLGAAGVRGVTALPRAAAEVAKMEPKPSVEPPPLPITDEGRLLTGIGARMPEFQEGTLESVSPRPLRTLPAPGETLRPSVATQTGEAVRATPGEELSTTTLREPINLPESPVGPRTAGYRVQLPKKPIPEVRQIALDELKAQGWNPKWPFVPADLMNADFRKLISDDPTISAAEKAKILSFPKGITLEDMPVMEQARPITLEDAKLLRGAIEIGESAATPEAPYRAPTVKTDLRQLEKVMQRDTIDTLESWADDVIRDKLGGASANPFFDPEFLAAATVKGAVLLKRGVTDFAQWSKPMLEQFGKGIEPHLQELFKSASGMAKVAAEKLENSPVVPLPPVDAATATPATATARATAEQSVWRRLFEKHFDYATPKEVFESATPVAAPVLDELATAIKDSKPARRATEALREKERSIRAARQAAIQSSSPGRAGVGSLKGALKGELPRVDLEPFADKLTPVQQDSLYNHIYGHATLEGNAYMKSNLAIALQDLMENGKLPQPSQIAWFERIFGPQVASALMGKQRVTSRSLRLLAELANIPRAAKSGFDLSATLRQGFTEGVAHPEMAAQAMKAQLTAFADRDYALAVDRSFRTGERARVRDQAGLDVPSVEGAANVVREENFTSRIVQNLQNITPKTNLAKVIYNPVAAYAKGLAGSERAYTTYLNWLRVNVFDAVDATFQKTLPEDQLALKRHQLAMLINAATGRGNVPSHALLNAVFFSPKFTVSRFEYPARAAKLALSDRTALGIEARRELLAQAGAWTGLFTLLSLGSAAFGWNIKFGHDPRNSDFLKVRLDDKTTIDFGAGYGQAIRFAAQFLSGQVINPKTGKVSKNDPTFQIGQFVRNKLAPAPGELVSFAKGKKPDGTPFSWAGVPKDLFAPITVENALDIWNEFGAEGLPLIVPDVLGANVSVYEPPAKKTGSILNP